MRAYYSLLIIGARRNTSARASLAFATSRLRDSKEPVDSTTYPFTGESFDRSEVREDGIVVVRHERSRLPHTSSSSASFMQVTVQLASDSPLRRRRSHGKTHRTSGPFESLESSRVLTQRFVSSSRPPRPTLSSPTSVGSVLTPSSRQPSKYLPTTACSQAQSPTSLP